MAPNIFGLTDPLGFEDLDAGARSQRKLADLTFEAACFGHGDPIAKDAGARLRCAFAR